MAKKLLPVLLTCCAGLVAGVAAWQYGDDLFPEHEEAAIEESAPLDALRGDVARDEPQQDTGLSIHLKTPLATNRGDKQDRDGTQSPLRGALPDADASKPSWVAAMPPQMQPKPSGKPSRAYLNDTQIAGIKKRLRLTKAQEPYWQPVEASLRSLMQQIADYQARLKTSRDASFDLDSDAIRQLKVSATAFLAQLRGDQKSELMMLANMAGLGSFVTALAAEQTPKEETTETAKREN